MIFKKLKNLNILVALCFLVLIFATLSVPAFSAYALDYVPLAPIPGTIPTACAEPPCGTTLSTYLTGMFKVGIAIAGVLAFLMIVFGGFTYLSTDAITGKEEGKERIKRALGGLILALAAFIILNTINPTLVNLNLNFGTAAEPGVDLSAPSEYRALVDQQLAELGTRSAREDETRTTEVNRLKGDAERFRTQANLLPDDDPNKSGLLAEADRITRQAEELDLQRVAAIQERLASENALNAYTPEKLATAITNAGTSVQKIQDAYTAARTAFASDPARVAALSNEEMERISVIRKSTAFGILDVPPLNNEADRASVTNEGGDVPSGYVDNDALNLQIGEQITQIRREQTRQKNLLLDLNKNTPTGSNLTTTDVVARRAKIDTVANTQICQIKNKCITKGYGCETLAGGVNCGY